MHGGVTPFVLDGYACTEGYLGVLQLCLPRDSQEDLLQGGQPQLDISNAHLPGVSLQRQDPLANITNNQSVGTGIKAAEHV